MSGDAPSTTKTDGDGTNLLSGLETEEHPEQVDLCSSGTAVVAPASFGRARAHNYFSRAGYTPPTPMPISPVPLLLYPVLPCAIEGLLEPTATRSIQTSIYLQKSLEQQLHEDPLHRPVGARGSASPDRPLALSGSISGRP